EPQRISDRGLLEGPPADGEQPLRQSHPEVQAAADAGFESIALDVYMNQERELLSIGSTELLELGEGVQIFVEDVTRAQLQTLQRPAPSVRELLREHPSMQFVFHLHVPPRPQLRGVWLETVVRTFAELPSERIMLTTSDAVVAGVLAGQLRDAQIPIALLEAPAGVPGALAWLQTARALDLPWLFLPPSAVDATLLETAHRWGVRVGLTGVTGASAVLRLMTESDAPDAYVASRAFLLSAPSPRTPTP
ncbi:MAG: hypothetical protein KC593_19810, partial [Myxococcales bacterium]|nr:hypothetical protein [Myxococcales bacterium]